MKNIILIGAPASGKGTQAELLVEKYNYKHISTGNLLREEAKTNEELRMELKTGKLISDEKVFSLLEKCLSKLDSNYLLDGFPRTVNQAIMYDELLKKINRELGIVILIDTDKDILMKRITGRRMCESCGTIYNIYNEEMKPKENDFCDKCHGTLYQRDDDNINSFEIRYNAYLDQTEKVLDYYENKKVLKKVKSSSNDRYDTFRKIEKFINE